MIKINPVRQKAFKVVYKTPKGNLYSATNAVRESKFCVNYSKGGLITPKVGELFVFDNLKSARNYQSTAALYEIWEVEAFGAKKAHRRANLLELEGNIKNLKAIWDYLISSSRLPWGTDALSVPNGTLYCKSLKMLRKVVPTPYEAPLK